jgi:hypothetical protein
MQVMFIERDDVRLAMQSVATLVKKSKKAQPG